VRLFPNAEHVVIADAGHWPHAERTAEFLTHVRQFLD
jgi:pimeloyl-ACP methyl ester carboxylesterase